MLIALWLIINLIMTEQINRLIRNMAKVENALKGMFREKEHELEQNKKREEELLLSSISC